MPTTQGAQTADRAIQLLLLAATAPEPLTLAELGREGGLNKAATYRLIQPLVKHGLLVREPNGRRYVVGSGLVALAATVMQRLGVRELARPVLEVIARETGETVGLYLRNGRHCICVDVVESEQPIRRVVPLGETLPLYSGPTGRAILAFLEEIEVTEVVGWAVEQGESEMLLERDLRSARLDGFLSTGDDPDSGVGEVSVPVFDAAGVVGGVSVSGPGTRLTKENMAMLAARLRAGCDDISRALGAPAGIDLIVDVAAAR
jgi:IclR family acetate operon transcriptional repressor